jgi:hypothetical protein
MQLDICELGCYGSLSSTLPDRTDFGKAGV